MIKEVIKNAEEKMNKTVSVLEKDLSTMKAGRANPSMLDKIQIDYYGTMCPLSQVANVVTPEPRVLMITPWEKPLIKEIEKAILKSDLGLNPSSDGTVIRLIIPELTEEEAKVAVRSIRKTANDKLKNMKKDADISEDEIKKAEDSVQKITDGVVKKIDSIITAKEKEVLSI